MKKILLLLISIVMFASCSKKQQNVAAPVVEVPNWEIRNYVDKFDKPIPDQSYLLSFVTGKFSNSATIGDNVEVIIYNEETEFEVKLLEYGKYKVTDKQFDVYYRGGAFETKHKTSCGSDGSICIATSLESDKFLRNLLYEGKDVDIVMEETGRSATSKYKFTIKAKDYKNVWNELYKK